MLNKNIFVFYVFFYGIPSLIFRFHVYGALPIFINILL